jgi:hypothetical protein
MNKIIFKGFCRITKSNNIKNLNSLINYVKANHLDMTNEEYYTSLNKFQEFETIEPNSKFKLYDFMDYLLHDEKKLQDTALLKNLMRVMISNQVYDELYWDYFKNLIIKHNMILSENDYNYLDILKSFSIINYNKDDIWQLFEEYYLEKYRAIEDVETIAICFANCRRGSEQFWETLITTKNLKSLTNNDFILNFSISLCGFLQSKVELKQPVVELFSDYLNFSIQHIHQNILNTTNIAKIDMIYPLFIHFHKSYHIDKLHTVFSVKKDILKPFVETLENILKNYFEKDISKLEDEDFEQISKILKYSVINKISFKELKTNIFIQIFVDNYNKMKNYGDIYNFLNYFMTHSVEKKKIEKVLQDEKLWEKFIENLHLINFEDVYNLTVIIKHYNVQYVRFWIIIQGYFKKNIAQHQNKETIEKILNLFKDHKEEYILVPFIYYLEKLKDRVLIIESHNLI